MTLRHDAPDDDANENERYPGKEAEYAHAVDWPDVSLEPRRVFTKHRRPRPSARRGGHKHDGRRRKEQPGGRRPRVARAAPAKRSGDQPQPENVQNVRLQERRPAGRRIEQKRLQPEECASPKICHPRFCNCQPAARRAAASDSPRAVRRDTIARPASAIATPARNRNSGAAQPPNRMMKAQAFPTRADGTVQESSECQVIMLTTATPRSQSMCCSRGGRCSATAADRTIRSTSGADRIVGRSSVTRCPDGASSTPSNTSCGTGRARERRRRREYRRPRRSGRGSRRNAADARARVSIQS